MARKGFTYKPCPGFGSSSGRLVDKVCDVCARYLESERERTSAIAEIVGKTYKAYGTVEKPYSLPYVRGSRDRFQIAIHGLSEVVSIPYSGWEDVPHVWPRNNGDYVDWRTKRMFEPKVAATLGEIYAAVVGLAEEAYKDGHQDGRDLLNQLASGEITADKFNDVATRVNERGL